jgi:hypothetical protein
MRKDKKETVPLSRHYYEFNADVKKKKKTIKSEAIRIRVKRNWLGEALRPRILDAPSIGEKK